MIRKLLIANRGEIVRRVARTCRDLGIDVVVIHSAADAGTPFVTEADEAVDLGGATPAESYLRADAVVVAALAAGADAVHPGYGFLSENAEFAEAVIAAGLIWVGPPPAAIRAMGSKLAARQLMGDAGVPVLAGEDLTGVAEADLEDVAGRVGWPVLVKASAGGGGRGMRIVRRSADLVEAVASARREAGSAFGDDTVFLEHYVDRPRHVEIQIMGDEHGTLVHLFERECSIQRRHQKIIEEAPSPAISEEVRRSMGSAAVAAGQAIGYTGAGTVEFVVAPDGDFFFLEVNTRLQVEHPVTEAVTGLDLVALQLTVAEGQPLPDEARTATIRGHAVEARLYAEDPRTNYLPQVGDIARFRIRPRPGLRVDTGVADGSTVSINYDPMLAKVVAHGATRPEALRLLATALRQAHVHGVTTNRDLLVAVLEHPDFVAGDFDTQFLERHPPAQLPAPADDGAEVARSAVAAALADQARARAAAKLWTAAPSGWRNNRSTLRVRRYQAGERTVEVGYAFGASNGENTGRTVIIEVDGEPADLGVGMVESDHVDLVVAGVRRRYSVATRGADVWVDSARGGIHLERLARFPDAGGDQATGSLVAPMPGTVLRLVVAEGDAVAAGQTLLVLEAMKMEHAVTAPVDGTVTAVNVEEGTTVSAGDVLVVVADDAEA